MLIDSHQRDYDDYDDKTSVVAGSYISMFTGLGACLPKLKRIASHEFSFA